MRMELTRLPAVAPAFQFYASDMMADWRWRCMSLAERGLLISMYTECWVNGSVPSNLNELSGVLGFQESELQHLLTARVMAFFVVDNAEMTAPIIDKCKNTYLENRRKKANAGRKGGQTTQSKLREMHQSNSSNKGSSDAKAHRVEMSGVEESKSESIENNIDDEFVNDYDENDIPF